MLGVLWVVVSDSKSPLVSSDVFMVEESSVASHSGLDLELDAVSDWVFWIVNSLSVGVPSLVQTVVALVVDCPSSIGVTSSVDVKASSGEGSDVLS